MVLCDLVQRLLIGPLVWLMPSSRKRILGAWMQAMAWLTSRPMVFLGGASIAVPPQVPFEPGVLIIMNHQSLLDIPMVCSSVRGGYPLIVTRKRYRHWIPLISHMIRLYQYPVVDPTANRRDTLGMTDDLSEVGPHGRGASSDFSGGDEDKGWRYWAVQESGAPADSPGSSLEGLYTRGRRILEVREAQGLPEGHKRDEWRSRICKHA